MKHRRSERHQPAEGLRCAGDRGNQNALKSSGNREGTGISGSLIRKDLSKWR